MALNGNQKQNSHHKQEWCGDNEIVAAAKMDEMLLEAIAALDHARALHETTPNPETKRQAKRIVDTLHSSLLKLAPLGTHSVRRLQQIQQIL